MAAKGHTAARRRRQRILNKKHYLAHTEQRRAESRAYYHAHKDDPAFKKKLKAVVSAWYQSPAGRRWYKANRKKYRAKQRRINKAWRVAHPRKYKVHGIVSYAIATGRLVKQPCAVCGKNKSEAHHENYNKPYEVTWLCRKCHIIVDKRCKRIVPKVRATQIASGNWTVVQ